MISIIIMIIGISAYGVNDVSYSLIILCFRHDYDNHHIIYSIYCKFR